MPTRSPASAASRRLYSLRAMVSPSNAYGYWPRFGLAYVDYATQRRTMKLSGLTYAGLIAEHAGRPSAAA